MRAAVAGLLVALAVPAWSAERAVTYGVVTTTNVAIRMDDGVVLKANVSRPASPDGSAAKGRFPVLLAQTPYGKDGPITSVNDPGSSLPDTGSVIAGWAAWIGGGLLVLGGIAVALAAWMRKVRES